MASPKTSFHTRSISFPSTSNPLDAGIENHLRRLRASQVEPSSSSLICQNLCSMKDLYEQVNNLIHLPHNQQILSHETHTGDVEEVLDGSLALLDASSSSLDALSQMKESILDFKSSLRRGSNDEGIHAYVMSRKKINKALSKCLVTLKKAEKNCALPQSENVTVAVRLLKEAEAICLSTLKSLILYMMGKKSISQTRSWSLVAKLVKSKHVSLEAKNTSEIENTDRILCTLSEKQSGIETKALLKQLEKLEMIIHELEDDLDSVSRCFVKTRVSLLNVLNH